LNHQPAPGLNEQLITPRLAMLLRAVADAGQPVETTPLDAGEAHVFLARAVQHAVLHALRSVPGEDRLGRQLDLCNRVLDVIAETVDAESDHVMPELLTAILAPISGIVAQPPVIPRPGIPLTQSALLVNAPRDHRIGSEVLHEIASADRIDLLCSFIKWSGFIRLREALAAHCQQGRPLRILTTAYMGATEGRALDELHAMGAEVRVSYNTQRTRLHAKAWLFHRLSGFTTAYIGSSNLSAAALSDGLEWNVRISGVEQPGICDKFQATFENYWQDPEFEPYTGPDSRPKFDQAIRAEQTADAEPVFANLDVRPYPFQEAILERLWVERDIHDRWRNLVVAATGTGKTVMAALDFQAVQRRLGPQRLLFIAHRAEILKQSLATFRQVLRDGQFGELYVEGNRPSAGTHVFASIQSLSHVDRMTLAPDAFDVVIVDEVHHSAATTYRDLLQHLRPRLLLGLTATPERTDGDDILHWFDDRISAELRLWEAIDRGLLAPFQYFALHDNTDLSRLAWTGGRYDSRDLEQVYTADVARVRLIVQAIRNHVANPQRMRALGFCVSVRHAEFMAAHFQRLGIAAEAVTGETDRHRRAKRCGTSARANCRCCSRSISSTRASTSRKWTRSCSCALRKVRPSFNSSWAGDCASMRTKSA
jgi:HKD family nuclease